MRILILVTLALATLASQCTHKKGPQVIPSSFGFIIKQNGLRLEDSILNNMKLFCFKNNAKTYISDFIRGINEGPFNALDLGVQTSRDIGNKSGDDGIKDFYLEYPNGDIDTLYVNYNKLSGNDAAKHPCYCYYPLEEVKFNGVTASLDTSIKVQAVYLFKKI